MGEVCGRTTVTGCGTPVTCERKPGHPDDHRQTWIDRDGRRQLLLAWTHENWEGHAVWPETPGALDVRNVPVAA